MSNKRHDNEKWLKIAGILSEAEEDEEGEDIFGDEGGERCNFEAPMNLQKQQSALIG